MPSKTLSFTSILPSITSVVKTDVNIKESPKRATGSVLIAKKAAKSVSGAKGRTAGKSWVGSNMIGLFTVIGLVAIVVGTCSYIYTINASVSMGFNLKQHQTALNELLETQKRLVVEQSALGSINKVNDVASTAGMVPVTNEEFLSTNQLSKR